MTDVIKGFDQFEKNIKKLKNPRKVRNLCKKSINFALTPVVKQVRANVPVAKEAHKTYKGRIVSPGFASRSVRKQTKNSKKQGVLGVGFVGFTKEAWYMKLYEHGYTHKGGKVFAPLHFMKNAYNHNKKLMAERFRQKGAREIIKMVK